ncbi:MAG: transglycosylase domain-containing protein [Desulfovibrionaceae bacterium]|nr:transglycosylase domain-containing protein [Desulfovibrionaceae bacterium]
MMQQRQHKGAVPQSRQGLAGAQRRSWMRGAAWFCAAPVFLCCLLWGVLRLSTPPPLLEGLPFARVVLAADGSMLRMGLAADQTYRLRVTLDEIAPEAIQALLLYEDKYFFEHPGVNPFALGRALWSSYLGGGRRMGASTITMQVVRLRGKLDTRGLGGKLRQIWQALVLERHYSKAAIVEAYYNLAPYGGNIEGIEAAARIYFHKPASRLTRMECFALTVIPQNPVQRNPLNGKEFTAARLRMHRLWEEAQPAEARALSPAPHQSGQQAGRALALASKQEVGQAPEQAAVKKPEHILGQSTGQVSKQAVHQPPNQMLGQKLGQGAGQQADSLPPLRLFGFADLPFEAPHACAALLAQATGASKLHTSIELPAQHVLESQLRAFVARGRRYGIHNAAALLVHAPTSEIRALVGSADFFNAAISGQVDGTLARRSPGSALKPFVYALALDQGLIHPMTLLLDSPRSFGGYDPENFDRGFRGPVPAHEALKASRNLPAIILAEQLHDPDLYSFLKKAGIALPRPPEHYGLALVLGGAEISMRELASLYGMLYNQGLLRPLRLLKEQAKGLGGGEKNAAPAVQPQRQAPLRMLSPEAAFITCSMLERPNAQLHLASGTVPLRYKTGTSNGFRDAWTAGIVGEYVLVVWAGNFDNSPNPLFVGGELAAPLFTDIAHALARLYPVRDVLPSRRAALNVRDISVCTATGDVDTSRCAEKTKTLFIPGVSPLRDSGVFRTILIDKASGLRACQPEAGRTEERVWEFWPSDVQRIFARAGIAKPAPPDWLPQCRKGEAVQGKAPRIILPKKGVTYYARIAAGQSPPLPLTASAEPDVHTLHWFAGAHYVGSTAPDVPLLWRPAEAGTIELRVVDDMGRISRQMCTIQRIP